MTDDTERGQGVAPGCLAWAPAVVVLGLVALAIALAPGCGASALRSHATAAVVATLAVESAEDVYLGHLASASAACSDEPCVVAARASHAQAEAALVAARTAVAVYRDAVEIANEADETGDLMAALISAALRIVTRWAEVARAFAGFGVELPALPIGGSS